MKATTTEEDEEVAIAARDEVEHESDADEKEGTKTTQESGEAEEDVAEKPKRKRKRKRKRKSSKNKTTNDDDDDTASKKAKKLTSLEYTVYIEGIPFDCSEEDVKEFFVSNGIHDILQMRLPQWQDSGRLRGYGHVVFDSITSQQKAIQDVSGMTLGKRYVTIQAPKKPREDTSMGALVGQTNSDGKRRAGTDDPSPHGDDETRRRRTQPEGCKTVFVKNLPYSASEEDIHDAFRVCGKILDGGVRIARNYQTRHSKGFAYVEFKNPEGAQSAVQKASKPFGMVVMGRPCFVDYDEGTMKGSFKNQDGHLWSREHKSQPPQQQQKHKQR